MNPYPASDPRARRLHKGFADFVDVDNLKSALTNPIGWTSNALKTAARDPVRSMHAMAPGMGKGLHPKVVEGYTKATFDPIGSPYTYKHGEGAKVADNAHLKTVVEARKNAFTQQSMDKAKAQKTRASSRRQTILGSADSGNDRQSRLPIANFG